MNIIAWNAVGNPIADGWENLPYWVFYKVIPNPNNIYIYPNTQLQVLQIYKWPDNPGLNPGTGLDLWRLVPGMGQYDRCCT